MMIARRSMRASALAKLKDQVVSSRFPTVKAPPHRSYVPGGSHQGFQDSSFFSGAGGERRNGPRDWLGLGLPLVWWGVAVVSIGGFFATGYELATAAEDGGEWAELVRRGSTGVWGAESQLEALLGLQAEIDGGALLLLRWQNLVPVGLIRCISSGVRSSNLQVSEAAWQLAADLCEYSPTHCKALLRQDLEFTRKSHSSEETSCDGDDNKEATVEGGDGLNRPRKGIPGLWSILASDLVVQLDLLASLQANSAERQSLLYRLNGRLRTLAALTTPQGAVGGYVGAFQARNSSDRAKYSAQDSQQQQQQQQQPSSTLFPLPSFLLRTIESPSNFASPSTLSAHNTGDEGGGGKEAAAASIADPRIVWAVVEVLALCHPELRPTLQSLTPKNGDNSENEDSDDMHESSRSSSNSSRNSLSEKFRALAETGDTFHGEEEMGAELFAQVVVFKMDELCCQILHNLVLTDDSGAVAEMLAAKLPMNLLLELAWDDELMVYHPAALALHTTLNHLRASGAASLFSSSPPSSPSAASRVVLDKIEQTWCPLFRPQTISSEDSKEKKTAKETAPPSLRHAATAVTATVATDESETSCDEDDDQAWLTKFAKELPPLPSLDPYSLDSLLSFHALAQMEAAVDAALVAMVYAPLRRWWQWRRSGEGQLLSQLEHMLNKRGATHTHSSTTTAAPANAAAAAAAATPPKGPPPYASVAPSASVSPSFFSQSHYSPASSSLSPTLSPSATVRQIPFRLNRSALSLRSVLLRSAASNALAATVLSMLYGVHGQMDEVTKRWESAHDESEIEYRGGPLTSTQVAASVARDAVITVSELAIFGAVIRVAPFCVFPCVWAYYSNEHNK